MLGRAAKTASHLATVEKELDVIRAEKASELNNALAALNESFFLLGQALVEVSAPEIFYQRAIVYMEMTRPDLAIKDLDRALELKKTCVVVVFVVVVAPFFRRAVSSSSSSSSSSSRRFFVFVFVAPFPCLRLRLRRLLLLLVLNGGAVRVGSTLLVCPSTHQFGVRRDVSEPMRVLR